AIMRAGRIIQLGTPRELYDRPATRWVASFIGQANLWDGRVSDDGRGVHTPIGVLACDTSGYRAGAAVTAMVRPEAIRPGGGDGAPNVFAGGVSSDRFLGSARRVDLSIGE